MGQIWHFWSKSGLFDLKHQFLPTVLKLTYLELILITLLILVSAISVLRFPIFSLRVGDGPIFRVESPQKRVSAHRRCADYNKILKFWNFLKNYFIKMQWKWFLGIISNFSDLSYKISDAFKCITLYIQSCSPVHGNINWETLVMKFIGLTLVVSISSWWL